MFTLTEVRACEDDDGLLGRLLFQREMLLPLKRACVRCDMPMHAYDDHRYALGVRLRCSPCNTDESVKRGSIFEHFHTPLATLCELVCYFDAETTVTQTARLTGISEDVITDLWKTMRERMAQFNEAHPVIFAPGDIVELDELFVKALLPKRNRKTKKGVWPPIIGCIARGSGVVALEMCRSHATLDIRRPILKHFSSHLTTVLTDRHASFNFLGNNLNHVWCTKNKIGAAVIPNVTIEDSGHLTTFKNHTNTIEGLWSQVRRKLHASHGWTAAYTHLILAEVQFRSLSLPLYTAFKVQV